MVGRWIRGAAVGIVASWPVVGTPLPAGLGADRCTAGTRLSPNSTLSAASSLPWPPVRRTSLPRDPDRAARSRARAGGAAPEGGEAVGDRAGQSAGVARG